MRTYVAVVAAGRAQLAALFGNALLLQQLSTAVLARRAQGHIVPAVLVDVQPAASAPVLPGIRLTLPLHRGRLDVRTPLTLAILVAGTLLSPEGLVLTLLPQALAVALTLVLLCVACVLSHDDRREQGSGTLYRL